MELANIDNSLMMVFLLEECNFSCEHCVRSDEPMEPGYKLSFEQLRQCLADCRNLPSIDWVHFSGGEPTLWSDGSSELVDLLLEVAMAGFEPGFTTNGSYFNNYDKCNELFRKYVDGADKPLRLFLSIDTFHHNFDTGSGRAKCLDNVIKFKNDLEPEKAKLINISLIAVISKDPMSLLPDEMINHYGSLGVKFNFIPLGYKGKAKALEQLCPDLASDKPEELGAYYRFHQKNKGHQPKSNLVLICNDYYFPEPWRKVAKLGHLSEKVIYSM